jgi:hypothetical protein
LLPLIVKDWGLFWDRKVFKVLWSHKIGFYEYECLVELIVQICYITLHVGYFWNLSLSRDFRAMYNGFIEVFELPN